MHVLIPALILNKFIEHPQKLKKHKKQSIYRYTALIIIKAIQWMLCWHNTQDLNGFTSHLMGKAIMVKYLAYNYGQQSSVSLMQIKYLLNSSDTKQ